MNKIIKVLTLVLALVFVLGFTAFADEEELKAEAYLAEYYGIELPEELSLEDMNAALTAVGAEPIEDSMGIYEALVKIADCEKLALSYIHEDAPDKAVNTLTKADFTVSEHTEPYAHFIACLLDLDIIDDDDEMFSEVTKEDEEYFKFLNDFINED